MPVSPWLLTVVLSLRQTSQLLNLSTDLIAELHRSPERATTSQISFPCHREGKPGLASSLD